MLNIKNTTDGYLKDVEIKGNTVQDAENLADIRSVGDKVEGQELYKIPVLSANGNLFDGNLPYTGALLSNGSADTSNTKLSITEYIEVEPNSIYYWKNYDDVPIYRVCGYTDKNQNSFIQLISNESNIKELVINTGANTKYIRIGCQTNGTTRAVLNMGDKPIDYVKKEEDKLTILSPVQLEKVGDVADRIICKGGIWGVEKSIKTKVYNGSEKWSSLANDTNSQFVISRDGDMQTGDLVICNQLTGTSTNKFEDYTCYIGVGNFNVLLPSNISLGDFVNSLKSNNLILKYKNNQPQFIPLPHSQQVKLRTFAGQTNIHFETEIDPTLKAQVPKSLGATVNSHTEQISNLNKELDRVKKLEESTVSTVVTESSFTTVEETSNGYFEDVKLEGKTLVNVLSPKYHTVGAAWGTDEKTFILDIASGIGQPIILGKFNQGLKRDTKYTAIVNVSSYTHGIPHFCFMNNENNKATTQELTLMSSGLHKLVFTTNADSDSYYFRILPRNGIDNKYSIDRNIIILEGDHTQNPPEYFEGLMSAGQDVDEVSVLSANDNLFDGELELGSISVDGNNESVTNSIRTTNYIPVKKNTNYSISNSLNYQSNIFAYDKDYKLITFIGAINGSGTFTTPLNCEYIRFRTQKSTNQNDLNCKFMLNVGTIPKPYQPSKQDKKRILYYNNETQTWEKPILRQWDSIEKHLDGKYYYHKRSGEIVLNGSETIGLHSTSNKTCSFTVIISDIYANANNGTVIDVVCDKFVSTSRSNNFSVDVEGISNAYLSSTNNTKNGLFIRIDKSKLSTQDVEGFKAWLQANPTTAVYQLAQEEVYECTNIDLITYANETNYIVNSGAIAPKSVLKVHNNVSNVVKILQEKVSLLESNVKASQEVQDMMILESDLRILDIELALMEHMPITLNLGGSDMLRSATYFNFLKNHIINETYEKEYLENVMNKYLATGRINQDEYDELYKMLCPPVYDIELPIEY